MQDINPFLIENFPDNIKLHGDSKFKTPRCDDEKVPIIVLPECVTTGISVFGTKEYLHVSYAPEERSKFEKITAWVQSVSSKPLYPIITDFKNKIQMKIRLPSEYSVLDIDGSEKDLKLSVGLTLQCAVEIPCLWETDDNVGLSFQMVQCKIKPSCMIQQMDEDPEYVPF